MAFPQSVFHGRCQVCGAVSRSVPSQPCQPRPRLAHSARYAGFQPRRCRETCATADGIPEPKPFETDLGFLGKGFARRLQLTDGLLQQLAQLPGTQGPQDLRSRAQALSDWRTRLRRGVLPRPNQWDWPAEPFQSMFAKAMHSLEMPRFCRRYPQLTDALLKQMLELVQDFEARMADIEQQQQQQEQQSSPQESGDPVQQSQQSSGGDNPAEGVEKQEGEEQESEEGSGEGQTNPEELTQEQLEEMLQKGSGKAPTQSRICR